MVEDANETYATHDWRGAAGVQRTVPPWTLDDAGWPTRAGAVPTVRSGEEAAADGGDEWDEALREEAEIEGERDSGLDDAAAAADEYEAEAMDGAEAEAPTTQAALEAMAPAGERVLTTMRLHWASNELLAQDESGKREIDVWRSRETRAALRVVVAAGEGEHVEEGDGVEAFKL